MAQDRTLAAGEQGSHLAPVGGGHRMPDEVDAAVNLVESGVAQAMLDLAACHASAKELSSCDHPVLGAGQGCDEPIGRFSVVLGTHNVPNPTFAGAAPSSGWRRPDRGGWALGAS